MMESGPGLRCGALRAALRCVTALTCRGLLAPAGALLAALGLASTAHAGPTGGTVVAGQGDISRPQASTTVVQQRSRAMAINWDTFNVRPDEVVRFNQPSASATVLNRVLNQSPSQIFGSVRANGQVFILNPGGVVIGKGARVNVGGLFLSSLDIGTEDFMAGKYRFRAPGAGTPGPVVNRGLIEAARGGSVTLLGGQVSNEGVIVADLGHVTLAAGRTATVDFDGDGLIRFQVDGEILENPAGAQAAVSNSGDVRAEGGQVLLSARVARDVFDRAVNNSGLIRAGSIRRTGGKVLLTGLGGGVRNVGTVDASGAAGGEVQVSSDVAVEQAGTIAAQGSAGSGGRVLLSSLGTTTAGDGSVTSARSEQAQGGSVSVLGNRVSMEGTARIDASGDAGGGVVLVGGDYRGEGETSIASHTFMSAQAAIDASARSDGHGGKVVVWADEVAEVLGSGNIDVRGGALGGDGGFAETSGKRRLVIGGAVDASAPHGRGGTWLLDPIDVTISNSGTGDVSAGGTFDMETSIDARTLVDALDGGSSVEIRTDGGTGGSGNITVADGLDAIDMMGSTATLTLAADNDIIITPMSGGIQSSNGTLDLELMADADGSSLGSVFAGSAISLASGALTVEGVDVNLGTVTATTVNVQNVAATATLGGTLTADTLNVTATTLNAAVTGDGNSVTAAVDFGNAGTLTLGQAAGTQTYTGGVATGSVGGTVTLNGTIRTVGADISLGAVESGSVVTLETGAGAGAITFGGTLDGGFDLGVDAGAGDVSFGAAAGGVTPLGAVTVLSARNVSIGGPFAASAFSQSAGSGTTVIGGRMDLGGDLSLSTAAVSLGADVVTLGGQSYSAATTLGGGARTVQSTGNGAVTFGGTLDGGFDLGVDAGAGDVSFGAAAGGVTPLGAVTVLSARNVSIGGPFAASAFSQSAGSGTTVIGGRMDLGGDLSLSTAAVSLGADVVTLGGQSYSAATTLGGGARTVQSTGNGAITFGGTLDGGFDLGVDAGAGDVSFGAAAGGVTPLGAVTVLSARNVSIGGPFAASAFSQSAGSGTTVIGGRMDLGGDLSLSTAAVSLGADVVTLGGQSYSAATTLGGGARTVQSTGNGAITFGGTLDGGFDLGVDAGAGDVSFGAAAGGVTPLGAVTVLSARNVSIGGPFAASAFSQSAGSGTTVIGGRMDLGGDLSLSTAAVSLGADVVTLGGQSYSAATTLGGGARTVQSTGNGAITFGGTLDGGFDLGVNTGGLATFAGAVGGNAPLASLTTDAGGASAIQGGGVRTSGAQTYSDAVNVNRATMLSGAALVVSASSSVTTSSNDLTLSFDEMALGGSLSAGSGTITVDTLTARGMNLGTETMGELSLTAAEMASISAGALQVGGVGAAPKNTGITISAAIAPAVGTLSLRSSGNIDASGGTGSVFAPILRVQTPGDLTLGGAGQPGFADVTLDAGGTLRLDGSATRFAGSGKLIADRLVLAGGAGSIQGPGSLTILRKTPADTTIGADDALLSASNLGALSGFNGTLGIGGTRTMAPTASQRLNDVTVSGALSTTGDVLVAGVGDITFVSGAGKITTPGTVTVLALGDATRPSSGNIFDTNASLVGDPVIQAGVIELAAAVQVGSEFSAQGALLNVTAGTISAVQGFPGEVQVRNTVFPESTGKTVLPVVATYASAGSPGGSLDGLINPAFVGLAGAGVSPLVTATAPTIPVPEDELSFIDAGVFLLPPAFTSPERSVLLPVLDDPYFPADQRPTDPDDEAAWAVFFDEVVSEFILSRYLIDDDASPQERARVMAAVTAELASVIAYYDAVRERERRTLASQNARGATPAN